MVPAAIYYRREIEDAASRRDAPFRTVSNGLEPRSGGFDAFGAAGNYSLFVDVVSVYQGADRGSYQRVNSGDALRGAAVIPNKVLSDRNRLPEGVGLSYFAGCMTLNNRSMRGIIWKEQV